MVVKKGLPDDVSTVLKQLVMNGHFSMAGRVLLTYCRRTYDVDEETAARWTVVYFQREFPQQLQKYRKRLAGA
ncbi:hypothetical protein [Bacillus sp. FJAT-26390]|uniref:hypothetical protein n=1 Tax=Bacillus sp. FJAT-26390 TaxID=1743142 RepID=UPI0008081395|nr:hypothetical protein [Bacillus sp. FJAT-26390]OBZ17103.1 hypothetical protein A7975_04235 [Bacillus sp. FJAT-26390]